MPYSPVVLREIAACFNTVDQPNKAQFAYNPTPAIPPSLSTLLFLTSTSEGATISHHELSCSLVVINHHQHSFPHHQDLWLIFAELSHSLIVINCHQDLLLLFGSSLLSSHIPSSSSTTISTLPPTSRTFSSSLLCSHAPSLSSTTISSSTLWLSFAELLHSLIIINHLLEISNYLAGMA